MISHITPFPWHNVKVNGGLLLKGLQTQRLIGMAVARFNYAKTITKASDMGLDARQDDYNKGICSPGNKSIIQLDRTALMLHSH